MSTRPMGEYDREAWLKRQAANAERAMGAARLALDDAKDRERAGRATWEHVARLTGEFDRAEALYRDASIRLRQFYADRI